MKKSMVLFMTLAFIMAMIALISQNLEDTNAYIIEQNHKLNKAQQIALVENTYSEVKRLLKQYGENFKENLDAIVLNVEESKVFFSLKNLSDKYDVNKLRSQNYDDYKSIEELFIDNAINDFDNFRYKFVNQKSDIVNSSKQLDKIIKDFMKDTYSNDILKIRNKLTFISGQDYRELKIKIEYLKDVISAYYILDKEGEVKYFELSFK